MSNKNIQQLTDIHLKLTERLNTKKAGDLTFRISKQIEGLINKTTTNKEIIYSVNDLVFLPESIKGDSNEKEFFEKMFSIYNRMETSDYEKLMIEGIKQIGIEEQKGAYIIAYRYDDEFVEKISDFGKIIREIVPSLVYDKKNIHTTLLASPLKQNFIPDENSLSQITDSINEIRDYIYKCSISFENTLFNSNSGIVAGIPGKNFISNNYRIFKKLSKKVPNLNLGLPWGGHITTHRFTKEIGGDELLKKGFFELINKQKSFGKQIPISIDIGYFYLSKNGFELNVFESIKI